MHCSRSPGRVISQHALQVSRPTPRGGVEGSGLGGSQAHTEGGGFSRPTPGGGFSRCTPHDSYCCRRYASYWNAFLFSWRNGSTVKLSVKESGSALRSENENFITCGQQSMLFSHSPCLRNPRHMSPEVTNMGVSGLTESPDVRGCKQQRCDQFLPEMHKESVLLMVRVCL